MRSWSICLFINFFLCYSVNAQAITSTAVSGNSAANSVHNPFTAMLKADSVKAVDNYNKPFVFMSSNYYTNSLGFFCKKEIQLEKVVKFPVKFRLGSVAYTDKMEGKGSGILPPSGKR